MKIGTFFYRLSRTWRYIKQYLSEVRQPLTTHTAKAFEICDYEDVAVVFSRDCNEKEQLGVKVLCGWYGKPTSYTHVKVIAAGYVMEMTYDGVVIDTQLEVNGTEDIYVFKSDMADLILDRAVTLAKANVKMKVGAFLDIFFNREPRSLVCSTFVCTILDIDHKYRHLHDLMLQVLLRYEPRKVEWVISLKESSVQSA